MILSFYYENMKNSIQQIQQCTLGSTDTTFAKPLKVAVAVSMPVEKDNRTHIRDTRLVEETSSLYTAQRRLLAFVATATLWKRSKSFVSMKFHTRLTNTGPKLRLQHITKYIMFSILDCCGSNKNIGKALNQKIPKAEMQRADFPLCAFSVSNPRRTSRNKPVTLGQLSLMSHM